MRLLFYLIVGFLIGGSCTYAIGQTYGVATLKSYHFDRSKNYNEHNLGFGLEHSFRPDFALSAGYWQNSRDRHTNYVLAGITPWQVFGWRLGAAIGGATGYDCGNAVCPVGALLATRDWGRFGVNVAGLPTVGVALQAKWRFSE